MKLARPTTVFASVVLLAGGAAVAVEAATTTDPVQLCSHNGSGAVTLPDGTGGCGKNATAFSVASDADVQALATRLDTAEAALGEIDPDAKATDSELLDGQDSTAFAAAGHDHDSRYYTKSETQGRVAPNSLHCPTGEVLRSVAADGTPTCENDANDTTYVLPVGGAIPDDIAASMSSWTFAGPSKELTNGFGTVVATLNAVVGSTMRGTLSFVPCRAAAGQPPNPFASTSALRIQLEPNQPQLISATAHTSTFGGTYRYGLCVRSGVPLDRNDSIQGTITVIQRDL